MHDPLNGELGRLVALAPPEHSAESTRWCDRPAPRRCRCRRCPPKSRSTALPTRRSRLLVEFAEQFSVDVSSDRRRSAEPVHLGARRSGVPRGDADILRRLPPESAGRPRGARLAGAVDGRGRLGSRQRSGRRAVQRVSSRRRPAARTRPGDNGNRAPAWGHQHDCRLCKSRREGNALDAGGSESLYEQIEHYETSDG